MIFEKLHRAINSFNKAFNWRQFRRDALHLGESLLVFGILYGIFSTVIWGVCWLTKINYDPDLIAVAWGDPALGLTEPEGMGRPTRPPCGLSGAQTDRPATARLGPYLLGAERTQRGGPQGRSGSVVRHRSFNMVQLGAGGDFSPLLPGSIPGCTTIDRTFTRYRKDNRYGRRLQGKNRSAAEQ